MEYISENYKVMYSYNLDFNYSNADELICICKNNDLYISSSDKTLLRFEGVIDDETYIYPYIGFEITPNNDCYKTSNFMMAIEKIDNEFILNLYVKKHIYNDICDFKINNIVNVSAIIFKNLNNKILNNLYNKELKNVPIKFETDLSISSTDIYELQTEIFDYQKNDLLWMRDIENNIKTHKNNISFKKNISFNLFNGAVKYIRGVFINSNLLDDVIIEETFNYNGGFITSDVGLGKTLVSLCHGFYMNEINKRDCYNHAKIQSGICNYFKKNNINCKSDIGPFNEKNYCEKHKRMEYSGKRPLEIDITKIKTSDFITSDKIKTNSFIVFCPGHICNQWYNECLKNFGENKKIILITNKNEYLSLKISDILFSDIVIVSYQFVTGTFYSSVIENMDTVEFSNDINIFLNMSMVELSYFEWNCLFVDEAHEIFSGRRRYVLSNYIKSLKTSSIWAISATPFTNGIMGFVNLLKLISDTKIPTIPQVDNYLDFFKKSKILFKSNTKEFINSEYNYTNKTEETVFIDFTNKEMNLYNIYRSSNVDKIFLIKLCCHTGLSYSNINECSFDEIEQKILDINISRLETLNYNISECKLNINSLELMLNIQGAQRTHDEILEDIKSYKTTLSKHYKEHDTINSILTYLKLSLSKINDIVDCSICLSECKEKSITKCGHVFCMDCICRLISYNTQSSLVKCPSCRTQLYTSEIFNYTIDNDLKNINKELYKYIKQTKSSKIANIIYYIKYKIDKNDKIVIYSQWDDMLSMVGKYLICNGHSIVYCKGNIYQKKGAILKFNNDPNVRIMLISSKNSSSGLDLSIANNIIFIEPIYGSDDYKTQIKTQTIGRIDRLSQKKNIKIINFIINNTIEENLI